MDIIQVSITHRNIYVAKIVKGAQIWKENISSFGYQILINVSISFNPYRNERTKALGKNLYPIIISS